jgi:hypothetical protein
LTLREVAAARLHLRLKRDLPFIVVLLQTRQPSGMQGAVKYCIIMIAEGVEVLAKSTVEEFWMLGDDRDIRTEGGEVYVARFTAVEEDGAFDRDCPE